MRVYWYRAVNMAMYFTSAKIVVFASLLTFVLTDHVLTAEIVFVTSSLVNTVRQQMTILFPFGIAVGSETIISCRRLQVKLLSDFKIDSSYGWTLTCIDI